MKVIKCSTTYTEGYGTRWGEFSLNVNVDETDEDDITALDLFVDRLEELFGNDFRFQLISVED